MAKKKEIPNIDDIIIKQYGDILKNANYVKTLRDKIIPVTPKFDVALSGGIPEGSFVTISGKSGQGKSSLCLQIAANAQKIDSDFGPRVIYYIDCEGRIKDKDLTGNPRLDTSEERFKLVQSTPGNILTGDDFIDISEKVINMVPGCILIFDSFSAICTKERYETDIKERFRDNSSLLLSSFCKRIAQVIPINKCIVMGITHLIANQGKGYSEWSESGGNKIRYQSDVKIMGTFYRPWQMSDGTTIGQETNWKIEKSALGPPFGEVSSYLRYHYGFDEYQDYIDIATDIGIINKAGAGWLTYNEQKAQGSEKMRNVLLENPQLFENLKKEVDNIFSGKK